MNHTVTTYRLLKPSLTLSQHGYLLRAFLAGLCLPFGFAPFHVPGFALLGLALFFAQLQHQTRHQSVASGFVFGLGFSGLGVSWVYVSIHQYGHLNAGLSGLITLAFIMFLALYPGLVALLYHVMAKHHSRLFNCTLFSALWCLSEALRGSLMGGFPWLLIGAGQTDTPLKYMLPIVGVYGVSFFACLAATLLVVSMQCERRQHYPWLIGFLAILLLPLLLHNKTWVSVSKAPISVGVVQANLSMRDKWDESLFWQILQRYKTDTEALIGKQDLIVLPESAIPLPESYLSDFLSVLHDKATAAGTAILLGIPQVATWDESYYYNSLIGIGEAKGSYLKQHLVPFGEFIPKAFQSIVNKLGIPLANLKPGQVHQPLVLVHNHPIATLICYELFYPSLLREQLPKAEWIVSISDDGWFGHSLAMYQQLQMAQTLSIQTGRYQVVSNNDGLSSIINLQGEITDALPAFSAGVLTSSIHAAQGKTPWVILGDSPLLCFSGGIVLLALAAKRQRRYPNEPN